MSKASCLLPQALVLTLMFLSLIQCSFSQDLISQTCKQTPNVNLCVKTLSSDPRGAKADKAGLALIMVDVIKSKATLTLDFINQQIQKTPGSKALISCASHYIAILKGDIPQATEGLTKGNPKFAQDSANDAANEANDCEAGFQGKSPMTSLNNAVHEYSIIASAIVKQLL